MRVAERPEDEGSVCVEGRKGGSETVPAPSPAAQD